MNIADFITELYCKIDDALPDDAPQHPQAVLSLSELITIGVLQAMKNVRSTRLLSLAPGQLWRPVSPTARTLPAQPPPGNAILLGRLLPGRTYRAGSGRQLRHRTGPSGSFGPGHPPSGPERQVQSPLDRGRQTRHRPQPVGSHRSLGIAIPQTSMTSGFCPCWPTTTAR